MIDGRSNLFASELNDIFARLSWHHAGLTAIPTDNADAVAIQYRSAKFGDTRMVRCDPIGLARWLKLHAVKPGAKGLFETLLDRKDAIQSAPVQALLDLSNPIARRAMKP